MKKLVIGIVFGFSICITSCGDNGPSQQKTGVDPEITLVLIKEKWDTNSQNRERIEARTKDPQGIEDPVSVFFSVTDNTTQIVFQDSLYDDGAYFFPQDGDVIAGDGMFSNTFSVTEINPQRHEETLVFSFSVTDKNGHEGKIIEKTVFFGANKAPEITQVSAPDTFPWYSPALLQATVNDSNGLNDIARLYAESTTITTGVTRYEADLYDDGDVAVHGDPVPGDGEYSAFLDSTFRTGKQGVYALRFIAEDSFGAKNKDVPERIIFVGNSVGSFISIFVPDTMAKPSGSSFNRELITARVSDPQGLADIDSVYFFSLRPDSILANSGQPFLLLDNGLAFNIDNAFVEVGDAVAGDGIYSFSLIVTSGTATGTYTFTFYMRDKAGNRTQPQVRRITIINRPI